VSEVSTGCFGNSHFHFVVAARIMFMPVAYWWQGLTGHRPYLRLTLPLRCIKAWLNEFTKNVDITEIRDYFAEVT